MLSSLVSYSCRHHRNLHSFPTRRSSDLYVDGQAMPHNPNIGAGINLNDLGFQDTTRKDKNVWIDWVSGAAVRQGLLFRCAQVGPVVQLHPKQKRMNRLGFGCSCTTGTTCAHRKSSGQKEKATL